MDASGLRTTRRHAAVSANGVADDLFYEDTHADAQSQRDCAPPRRHGRETL